MAIYGFGRGPVLPVWVLLAPRDYLSSLPEDRHDRAARDRRGHREPEARDAGVSSFIAAAGRSVRGRSSVCVHHDHVRRDQRLSRPDLVGTTPKMIDEVGHPVIGYGAMLIEGLVGIVANGRGDVHAGDYFAMNDARACRRSSDLSVTNRRSSTEAAVSAPEPGGPAAP